MSVYAPRFRILHSELRIFLSYFHYLPVLPG